MRERAAHLAHRYGHYGYYIMASVLIASSALDFLPHYPRTLHSIVNVAFIVAMVFAAYAFWEIHGRRLCIQCAEKTPLNGGLAAEKHKRALRTVHWYIDRPRRTTWIVGSVALAMWLGMTVLPKLPSHIVSLALTSSIAVTMLCINTHFRLEPWCPQCGWNRGGGEGREDPAPTPSSPSHLPV